MCGTRTSAGAVRTSAGVGRTSAGVIRTGAGVVRTSAGVVRTGAGVVRTGAGVVRTGAGSAKARDGGTYQGIRQFRTQLRIRAYSERNCSQHESGSRGVPHLMSGGDVCSVDSHHAEHMNVPGHCRASSSYAICPWENDSSASTGHLFNTAREVARIIQQAYQGENRSACAA